MNRKLYSVIGIALCIGTLIIQISCGSSSDDDIETVTDTQVLKPKVIDTPTSLRIPTSTPEPTSTPQPIATPVLPTPTPTQIPPTATPTSTATATMTPIPVMPTPDSLLMTIQAILLGDRYCKMFIESEGDSAICKVEPTNNNSILISLWTPNQAQIAVYRNLVVKNFEEQGLDKLKIVFPDVGPALQLTATPELSPTEVSLLPITPESLGEIINISEIHCEAFLADKSQGAICRVEKIDEMTVSIGTWLPDKWVHESSSERDTQVQNFKKELLEEIENQGLNGIGLKFSTVEPETSTAEESSTEDTISFVSDITAYEFDDITVIVGTEVKWVNKHSDFHTVTGESSTDLLDSPQLSQGASYSFKFNEPGKYQFICQFHDDMRATVTVTE